MNQKFQKKQRVNVEGGKRIRRGTQEFRTSMKKEKNGRGKKFINDDRSRFSWNWTAATFHLRIVFQARRQFQKAYFLPWSFIAKHVGGNFASAKSFSTDLPHDEFSQVFSPSTPRNDFIFSNTINGSCGISGVITRIFNMNV